MILVRINELSSNELVRHTSVDLGPIVLTSTQLLIHIMGEVTHNT